MKQILTLTLLIIASLTSNAQKRIESDYSKSFIIDYIWNDYNLNGELDAGEQYKVGDAEATVTLIYIKCRKTHRSLACGMQGTILVA